MDTSKIDLNKPAFGAGAQSLEELLNTTTPIDTSVEETPQEVKEESEVVVPSAEETKVPYSRFKNVNEAKRQAEAEAEAWRLRYEELESKKAAVAIESTNDVPDYWVELYGDTDASAKAWKIQQKMNEEIIEKARLEAYEAVRNERYQEESKVKENLSIIEQNFEELRDFVGRDLTEKEESAVLDIIDDYTPKDKDGNYLGATLPYEKAWEIYEMKQQVSKAPRTQARDSVASLTGTNTQGNTSIQDKDNSFNPLDWQAWRKRI